jgi:group I intron endonuclease
MRDIICGIYSITNLRNNKKYIGQTIDFIERRRNHINKLNINKHKNEYLQNSWNKYGKKSFKFEMIFMCSYQDLNSTEIFFIDSFKTSNRKYGYNLREGGNFSPLSEESKRKIGLKFKGRKHSEEHKRNQSDGLKRYYLENGGIGHMKGKKHSDKTKEKMVVSSKKTNYKHSDETKRKLSESHMGNKNPMFGKPMSTINKEALRKAHLGKPRTEEVKQKIRNGWTEETRKRVGESRSGSKNNNFGKPMSEETKIRLRLARQKASQKRKLIS